MKNEYFLRRWRITFVPDQGNEIILSDSELKEKALHCEFECEQSYSFPLFGAVSVYNLSWQDTSSIIRTEKALIRIEAGYKDSDNFGIIWEAPVIQYIRSRERVVDWVLTFSSVNSLDLLDKNWICTSVIQSDPRSRFEAACNGTYLPDKKIPYKTIIGDLSTKKLERQRVLFGNPGRIFEDLEKDQRVQISIVDKKLNVSDMAVETGNTTILKSPKTGLIGTPQQTQHGISFTCLLDPRLKFTSPVTLVQIEDVLVSEQRIRPQAGSYPAIPLDVNGIYKILSVRHYGGVRSNDWYSDVTAANTVHDIWAGLAGGSSSAEKPNRNENTTGKSPY